MARTFSLLRTLGRGAHGTVHLAELREDEGFVQTLAVKRLLPEWSADGELAARLKDEARLLALLHHDAVVRVHGLTRIDGGLAILMEPVDGVDLGALLRDRGALPPRVALEIVEGVADALDAAWQTVPPGARDPLRVVHRDIKPSNVMVTPRGRVKVMDFGVARASFEAREVETRSQQYGTARYMAPERWLEGVADHRSDVFSLGITLVELVGGQPVARPRLVRALFDADLAAATAGLDPVTAELALAMTRFDAAERPSAAEVVARIRALLPTMAGPSLREWAVTNALPAPPAPVLEPTVVTTVQESPLPRTGTTEREPPPVAPVLRWWHAALGVIVLAAVPVGRRWRAPDPAPEPVVVASPAPEAVAAAPVVPEPALAETALPRPQPPSPTPTPATARPAPVDAPAPEPSRAGAAPGVPVTFLLPKGYLARVGTESIGSPDGAPVMVRLPANTTVRVDVTPLAGRPFACTIHVGASVGAQVRIDKSEAKCVQR